MKEFLVSWLDVSPTLMWGDVALFNILDSYKLLDSCEKNNIAVLGIEGFRIFKSYRVPDMGCIVDFSGLLGSEEDFSANSREKAKKFIDDIVSDDVLLEFVLVKC